MDEKKTLLSYIGPGRILALVCLLLLGAALFCGLYRPPVEEIAPHYPPEIPSDAPAFAAAETAGELVYLDTIAVSDAICSGSGGRLYYAVEDEACLFRIVCISGQTYALMGAQRALWNDPGAEASSFRLTGRRMLITDEVKQSFLEVFSMDGAVFDNYFGRLCLVEELPAGIEATRSPAWGVFAVLFALGFAVAAVLWLGRFLPSRAALARLARAERLSDAAQQLDDPSARIERGDRLRITEGYLFGWHCGLAAAWEDVVWCYERSLGFGFAALVIRTRDGMAHSLLFPARELKELRRLANILMSHCPDMCWGQSAENRAAWRGRSL